MSGNRRALDQAGANRKTGQYPESVKLWGKAFTEQSVIPAPAGIQTG
jgi:hypothetical protein